MSSVRDQLSPDVRRAIDATIDECLKSAKAERDQFIQRIKALEARVDELTVENLELRHGVVSNS